MVADGHTGRIVNIDISAVVIEQMREKYGDALPPSVTCTQRRACCRAALRAALRASRARQRAHACPHWAEHAQRGRCAPAGEVADVTSLGAAYPDASFDAAIDKGTMDALMVSACARSLRLHHVAAAC
jgi:hypothetical protein